MAGHALTRSFISRHCCLLLFLLPALVWSQDDQTPTPFYKHFSVGEGLPSSETYCVIQDSKGFVWVSTDRGVVRYDGEHFETFTTEDGLQDNVVFKMLEDSKGRIWMAPYNNRLCYYQNGAFHKPENAEEVWRQMDYPSLISELIELEDGRIFVETNAWPFFFDPEKGEVTAPADSNVYYEAVGELAFRHHPVGSVWKGDEFYKWRNWDWSRTPFVFSGGDTVSVSMLVADGKGNGNSSESIMVDEDHFFVSHQNLIALVARSGEYHMRGYHDIVTFIKAPEEGKLMFGVRRGGFRICDDKLTELAHLLPELSVSYAMYDREGNLWLTTLEDGVYRVDNPSLRIVPVPEGQLFTQSRLATNGRRVLLTGYDRAIMGYSVSGELLWLSRLKSAKKLVADYSVVRGLTYDEDRSQFLYGQDVVGAITEDGVQLGTIFKNDTIGVYPFMVRTDDYLLTGYNTVMAKAYEDSTYAVRWPFIIQDLVLAKGDTIWMGTLRGLYGTVDCDTFFKLNQGVVDSVRINDLQWKDKGRDTLLIGTMGEGLLMLTGGSVHEFKKEHGLASNLVNTIEVDERGTIWLGTNLGLHRLQIDPKDPAQSVIQRYYGAHGLPSSEIQDIVVLRDTLWCATPRILFYVPVDKLELHQTTAPIYINRVHLGDSLLPQQEFVVMQPSEKNLQISFVGLSLRNQKDRRYRYRLLGYDDAWVETKLPAVNYNSLPSGDYEFEVEAINENGDWSTESARLEITVKQTWYQSWWAWTMFCIAGILLIYGVLFLWFRIRNQRRLRELERIELESKALRAQMNPHFIFNAMNAVQRYISRNDALKAGHYLAKFSRLVRLNLELSRQSTVVLQDELDALELYIEFERSRFRDKMTFVLDIDEELDITGLLIPPMLVQPLIENAIVHGLGPKEGEGTIIIRFSATSKSTLVVTIEDDGVGRKAKKRAAVSDEPEHQSHGVQITMERLRAHRHKRMGDAVITYTDLTHPDGSPAGTRVQMTVPCEQRF